MNDRYMDRRNQQLSRQSNVNMHAGKHWAKQNSVMVITGKHTVEQNNVMHVAGQQHALHKIVLAVARYCENKKSLSRVDVCQISALQQNVGTFAGQNVLLRRIVGLNVGQHEVLQRFFGTVAGIFAG